MSNIPENLLYTKEHEWVRFEGGKAVVGVTDHAQHQLGDVVFVDLPEIGDEFEQFKPFGSIESVKAASDLFSPLSGKVVEVNEALADKPETVNREPYGEGWLIAVEPSKPDAEKAALLDAAAYAEIAKD